MRVLFDFFINIARWACHTMGGVTIDEDTRILDKNGRPIRGLYAAGEITGGIHGTNRVGCNAVPDALIFGTIAGREVGK